MANVLASMRVLRMHEVLLAIKLVKFYVWERSFAKQVEEVTHSGQMHYQLPHHPKQASLSPMCLAETAVSNCVLLGRSGEDQY